MKFFGKVAVVALAAMIFCGTQTADAFPTVGSGIIDKYVFKPIPTNRGSEDFDKRPQPGFNVTLLGNQRVHFAWTGKSNGNFIIKDAAGKIVFERAVDGNFELVPAESKLKSGEKYSWSVDGGSNVYKFTVVDEQTENEILANLAELDAQTDFSAEERALRKALYVQLISDEEAAIDLYWLSAQWLTEISTTDAELKEKKLQLLERCDEHHAVAEMRWQD